VQEIKNKIEQELTKGTALSIIKLVDDLVEYAYSTRASDIHIDPLEKTVSIRLRIDGVLHTMFSFPKEIYTEVIARVKVLAGMRTDEHQAAQDGRFRTVVAETNPIDVRISIVPTYFGENAILRLLTDTSSNFSLESLGFSRDDIVKITHAIKNPHGMILATGPTGSGKTTTLYTLLKMLNTNEVAIVTIEDPIEYALEGIKQIQVNPRAGLNFANGLRSILRQDPNIIMVGEIRDTETASIAVNTALTGHMLLSTLHTNDAATTLPRLLDMKIDGYLVASTINVTIGQRLVRKICEHCKTKKNINATEEKSIQESLPPGILLSTKNLYYGKGCEKCSGSGYQGRLVIAEVLVVDHQIREAILRKAPANEIKALAQKNGMTSMFEEGVRKVEAGLTTIEDVFRVIHE
jgi:type IV pilus assembly protein PilB